MPENKWNLRKLRPDVLDEILEQKYGKDIPQIIYAMEQQVGVMLGLISLFPTQEYQAKAIVSAIVGLLYPQDKETCILLLDSARKFVENHTKEEE